MWEILCKVLFFLSMLVVYANVTSTGIVIVIVLIYVACVFSYYYFDNIQAVIDEWFNYLNVNARLNEATNPSHLSDYIANRKFNKMNNGNTALSSVNNKKIFGTLCSSDGTFVKEINLLESRGSSVMKTNGDLPSPIMKNGSPLRSNRLSRDSLKLSFNPKSDVAGRKNVQTTYGSLGSNRRYNSNLDLETFMNVSSPGFTSRVVDKATESASYHIKYPAVRQIPAYRFDKSTLRQLSKIPKVNSSPAVRIAPPELNKIDLLNTDGRSSEPGTENLRSNDYLQVLKDISRKRNYCQEETDRNVTTPKKSRKNDVKNAVSSQYKRAHEDCSNESIDDKSCKKRCDDVDRNHLKILSCTSSMSVLVPEFCNTKKRKSSRLEKSKNESPENMEKCRKIDEDVKEQILEDEPEKKTSKLKVDSDISTRSKEVEVQPEKHSQGVKQGIDETDSFFSDSVSVADENEEYIRVAGGKILNRTNCTYRKKLNSTKIDPVSVISTEPEYAGEMVYVDDKTMKENLLSNLVNDIERKGDKNDSVIFYQNSIVEEIEKKTIAVEVHKTDSSILTSSSFNPLLPPTEKPAVSVDLTDAPVSTSPVEMTKSTTLMENSSTLQKVFNDVASFEASKNVLKEPPEKIEIFAEVHRNSSPNLVSSSPKSLLPPSTAPVTSAPQFSIPISTPTVQFGVSSVETSKPNLSLSVANTSSVSFGGFDKTESGAPVFHSNNAVNKSFGENSSSVSSAFPATSYNSHLKSPPKSTASNDQSGLSVLTAGNTAPIVFGSGCQTITPSTTSSNSLFAFNKPVVVASTTPAESVQSLVPIFTPSSISLVNSSSSSAFNSTNSSSPAPMSVAVATTTPTSSSFSTNGSTFGTINPTTQNQTSTFNFGSQSTPTFGQSKNSTSQTSVFNAGIVAKASTQSPMFDGSLSTSNAQSNIFGAVNQQVQANPPLPLIFGANLQSAPSISTASTQPSIFGTSTQPVRVPTSSMFGSNMIAQSSAAIFGSVAPSQPQQLGVTSTPSLQAQSLFVSAGDTSANIFGQNQSTAPPVGVVNPLPQSAPQFGNVSSNTSQFGPSGSSARFAFGGNSSHQPVAFGGTQPPTSVAAPATSTPAPSPFGTTPAPPPPTFGVSGSGPAAFNFNASSTFGTANNSFGSAASSAPPSTNPMFNFGSSNAQPVQQAFPFGVANSASPSNPPFVFGGNPTPVANAGGFSIGSGGSTRNRPMARPRKAK